MRGTDRIIKTKKGNAADNSSYCQWRIFDHEKYFT